MQSHEFEKFFDDIVDQERNTLILKAFDYASHTDRFRNFNDGADFTGMTPAQTLWGYLAKHLSSIREMVRGKSYDRDYLREKIGDARNYLVLLEALLAYQSTWWKK